MLVGPNVLDCLASYSSSVTIRSKSLRWKVTDTKRKPHKHIQLINPGIRLVCNYIIRLPQHPVLPPVAAYVATSFRPPSPPPSPSGKEPRPLVVNPSPPARRQPVRLLVASPEPCLPLAPPASRSRRLSRPRPSPPPRSPSPPRRLPPSPSRRRRPHFCGFRRRRGRC